MGCWNGTCALSNLPVYAGDDVYVFILMQPFTYGNDNYDIDNRCYVTTWWAPLPIHFEGQYNDYGAVEDCKGELIPLLLDTIRDQLVEFDLGENQYHDIPVKRDKFDVELLFEADHENRFFINDPWKKPRKAAHIIVHKSILDGVLKAHKMDRWTGDPVSYTELMDQAIDFGEQVMTKSAKDKRKGLDVAMSVMMSSIGVGKGVSKTMFSNWFESAKRECPMQSVDTTLIDLIDNQDEERLNMYMRHLALWIFLRNFMETKRTAWVPPCGAGSQDSNTSAQELIAKLTIAKAKQQKKMFDEN